VTVPQSQPELADVRAARALATLAGICAELASARPLETSIERVLGTVRETLGADECAVWLHTPQGLSRGWGSGTTTASESEVRGGIIAGASATTAGALEVTPIALGERRVGALATRVAHVPLAEERQLLRALGDVLAPELAHAERSRQLEVEIASRTRELASRIGFVLTVHSLSFYDGILPEMNPSRFPDPRESKTPSLGVCP
jgi:hypothetical protein